MSDENHSHVIRSDRAASDLWGADVGVVGGVKRRRNTAVGRAKLPTSGAKVDEANAPKLPHERDESSAMTGGIVDPVTQQAFEDLERGLQDTGRAAEADRTYAKQKS